MVTGVSSDKSDSGDNGSINSGDTSDSHNRGGSPVMTLSPG